MVKNDPEEYKPSGIPVKASDSTKRFNMEYHCEGNHYSVSFYRSKVTKLNFMATCVWTNEQTNIPKIVHH